MTTIHVTDRAGQTLTIEGKIGESLMEAIRNAGFDEMLALCGGCCSCATCHVHVVNVGSGELPEMTEDERDLLDASTHVEATSRLACQISLGGDLDNLSVAIAPED